MFVPPIASLTPEATTGDVPELLATRAVRWCAASLAERAPDTCNPRQQRDIRLLYPTFGILLSPILAAAAMGTSSIFVLTNALRLKSFRAPMREPERRDAAPDLRPAAA